MRLLDLTALGRPIDPGYPTNRAIAVLALASAVAAGIWGLLSGMALPTCSPCSRCGRRYWVWADSEV